MLELYIENSYKKDLKRVVKQGIKANIGADTSAQFWSISGNDLVSKILAVLIKRVGYKGTGAVNLSISVNPSNLLI